MKRAFARLRSVLRAVLDERKLAAMPRMPAMPKKGRKVLIPLSANQVGKTLAALVAQEVEPPPHRDEGPVQNR